MARLAATAALFTALCAGSAAAIDLPPGAEGLRIEPFEGYCSIDPGNSNEAKLLEFIRQVEGPSKRVIDLQMDCATLETFRASTPSTDINPLAVVSVHVDAAGRATMVNLPRATYMDLLEKLMSTSAGERLTSQEFEDSETRLDQALNKLEERVGVAVQTRAVEMLGVIDRDEDALYTAALGRYEVVGVPYVDVIVSRVTLIRGHTLAVRLQRSYTGPDLIRSMASEVAAMIRQLIALNEGSL